MRGEGKRGAGGKKGDKEGGMRECASRVCLMAGNAADVVVVVVVVVVVEATRDGV